MGAGMDTGANAGAAGVGACASAAGIMVIVEGEEKNGGGS